MSVQNVLNSAIFNQLAGGTALINALGGTAIYWLQAPDNAPLPYVIFSEASGLCENINPSDMRDMLYFVRVWAEQPAQAGSIDKLIHDRLQNQTLTVTGYTNFWTFRENDAPPLVVTHPDNAKVYMAGAYYRIRLTN